MGKLLDCISLREEDFIASQKVFFVATAPLSANHYINVSPKSPGTSLVVLGPNKVAYADLTGSGAEAAANVQENGRMTIMFVNIEDGPPKILRLYGTARVVAAQKAEQSLLKKFSKSITNSPGFRAVFLLDVERVTTSCGYSMPILTFDRYRSSLDEWFQKRGPDGMDLYRLEKNSFSINALDSLCTLWGEGLDRGRIKPVRKDGYVLGVSEDKEQNQMSILTSVTMNAGRSAIREVERFASRHLFLTGLTVFVIGVAVGKVV